MEDLKKMIKKKLSLGGSEFFFETGRIARQADASVLIGEEGTTVLVTAVASKGAESDRGFFPLWNTGRSFTRQARSPEDFSNARVVPAKGRL